MFSYAQNFEDVILNRCFQRKQRGFYIDVGAWDPFEDSVTRHFYEMGWSGINVEPDAEYAKRLSKARDRDITLRVALGEAVGKGILHRISEPRLSTLSSDGARFLESSGYRIEGQEEVSVSTLKRICEAHVTSEIDFLKIDTEGSEASVIKGADWITYRPCVVLVEAVQPCTTTPTWPEWEPLLLDAGYEFVLFDGLNRFFLREESRHLRSNFDLPPNCTDDFTLGHVAALQNHVQELRSALETKSRELCQLEIQHRAEIGRWMEYLGRLSQTFSDEGSMIQPLRDTIASQQLQIMRLQDCLINLSSQTKDLNATIADQRQQLADLKYSLSWRATGPIRTAWRIIQSLVRNSAKRGGRS